MFTGIIEGIGTIVELRRQDPVLRLKIGSEIPSDELGIGDSVAVDGVCLTVVQKGDGAFACDIVPETVQCTTLSLLREGSRVNLERSLRLADRLDGHLVQGHVDVTAPIRNVLRRGGDYRLEIDLLPQIAAFIANKGSVTLQGVSLTVAALRESSFEVALVPQTLRATNLGDLRAGGRVNVEVDLLARYLDRLRRRAANGDAQDGHG